MAVYPYTLMCENYPVQYSGKDEGDAKERIEVFEILKKVLSSHTYNSFAS